MKNSGPRSTTTLPPFFFFTPQKKLLGGKKKFWGGKNSRFLGGIFQFSKCCRKNETYIWTEYWPLPISLPPSYRQTDLCNIEPTGVQHWENNEVFRISRQNYFFYSVLPFLQMIATYKNQKEDDL